MALRQSLLAGKSLEVWTNGFAPFFLKKGRDAFECPFQWKILERGHLGVMCLFAKLTDTSRGQRVLPGVVDSHPRLENAYLLF